MSIEYPFTYKAENVVQTGAAQEERAGVPDDPVTITVTEIYYKFKVVLPDVARNLGGLTVAVLPNGEVEVEGIVKSGEITSSETPVVCNRRTRRIFPPGHFTISFTLAGPAESQFVTSILSPNGVLVGIVPKRRSAS